METKTIIGFGLIFLGIAGVLSNFWLVNNEYLNPNSTFQAVLGILSLVFFIFLMIYGSVLCGGAPDFIMKRYSDREKE